MRLLCVEHGKRVFVFRGKGDKAIVAHRSGDMKCSTDAVIIGKHKMTPQSVIDASDILQRMS